MRRCPCPVWIVDPERKASEGNVLAAVDPFIENGEDPLNIMIIELATSIAQMQQGKLHVVHAWTASEEQALRHSPFLRVTPSETMDYVRTIEAQHRQRLDALVARYLDLAPDIEVHLVKGPADEVVPAVARGAQHRRHRHGNAHADVAQPAGDGEHGRGCRRADQLLGAGNQAATASRDVKDLPCSGD
jgi:hypothetical protein